MEPPTDDPPVPAVGVVAPADEPELTVVAPPDAVLPAPPAPVPAELDTAPPQEEPPEPGEVVVSTPPRVEEPPDARTPPEASPVEEIAPSRTPPLIDGVLWPWSPPPLAPPVARLSLREEPDTVPPETPPLDWLTLPEVPALVPEDELAEQDRTQGTTNGNHQTDLRLRVDCIIIYGFPTRVVTLFAGNVAVKRALLTVMELCETMLCVASVTHGVMLQGTTPEMKSGS